jgi:predicted nucleic acid-binding protein
MGHKNYLIDTNVAIYYFGMALSKNSEAFIDKILINTYYVSVINRIELLGFKGLNQEEINALELFIKNSVVIDLDEEIVLETIRIRKEYSIKVPDAIIAATCLINNCELISNNIRDFKQIHGLNISPVQSTV